MKDIVIFTAIFGGKDRLPKQHFNHPRVDFVCFTEDDITIDGWEIIKCSLWNNDPIKTSKMYKIIAHKFLSKYKYAIWIDGHCVVKNTILEPLKYLTSVDSMNNYAAVFLEHNEVESLYGEADHLIELWYKGNRKDTPKNIRSHIQKYIDEGYPSNNGLTENTVFWRKLDNEKLNKVMDLWWEEVIRGSIRDQLSLMYCFWKHNYSNYFLLNAKTENITSKNIHAFKEKYYHRTNHIL